MIWILLVLLLGYAAIASFAFWRAFNKFNNLFYYHQEFLARIQKTHKDCQILLDKYPQFEATPETLAWFKSVKDLRDYLLDAFSSATEED